MSIYFGVDHAEATAHFKPESPPDPKSDDLPGQEAYALWLTETVGMNRNYFTIENHLCRLVLKEAWPVEIMSGPAVLIHPQDLENLILFFDSNVDLFAELTSATNDPEFAAPALKAKNKINNLSEEYFQSSVVDDMPQFKAIQGFLMDPRNRGWLGRYNNVAQQFKNKYQTHRSEFGAFETIFDDIFDRLQARER